MGKNIEPFFTFIVFIIIYKNRRKSIKIEESHLIKKRGLI